MMAAKNTLTVEDMLREFVQTLSNGAHPGPTPRLDVEVLASHVTGLDRAGLIAHGLDMVKTGDYDRIAELVARRLRGEPIAHITGQREFFGLALEVSKNTLIPRPETELLVEAALGKITPDTDVTVLDLGTGTGAVALSIKNERPRAQVTATDASAEVLDIAHANAEMLGLDIKLEKGHWYDAVQGKHFDIIVSNPPYVRLQDPHLQEGDVRFEPKLALASGDDGLDDIRKIISGAQEHLNENGWLLLEHGYDQGPAVRALMKRQGGTNIVTLQDLAGLDRVSLCQVRG